jgi:chromate reductase, NAD(P)H dehydrogenase (quinone)
MKNIKLLGFSGSLRKRSYNRQLLELSTKLIPENTLMEIFDLSEIPLYNHDLEEVAFPSQVTAFKETIRSADGILIASPEYNYSIPGVLKNSIDWASRPFEDNPFNKKAAAIMSASTSRFAGARAQQHLRQTLSSVGLQVMTQPEFYLPHADKTFGDPIDIDPKIEDRIKKFLNSFITHIHQTCSTKA